MKIKNFSILLFLLSTLNCPLLVAQHKIEEDPYIWLEEVESKKSMEWVKEQNKYSDSIITRNPLFKSLRSKYLEIYNDKERVIYADMLGEYVYDLWQDETNERGIWRRMLKKNYVKNENNWETLLDLDKLSEKEDRKWVFDAVTWLDPTHKKCLIALSDGGKDENILREFDVETKTFIDNGFTIKKESKGGADWVSEDELIVARDFGEGTLTTSGYPRTVKLWQRGTDLEKSIKIFETDSSNVGVFVSSTYNMNKYYTFIYNALSFYETEIYLVQGENLKKLDIPLDAGYLGFFKGEVIFTLQSDWMVSNEKFTKGSVVSASLNDLLKGINTVKTIYTPDEKSSFNSLSISKDFILLNILENVKSSLIKSTLKQKIWKNKKVDTPEFGTIEITSSDITTNDYFFAYSNFLSPTTLYYANDEELSVVKKRKEYFETEGLVVKQHYAISKDKTKIPYFIVHKKDIEFNSSNPTLIYAYGGFNSPVLPFYSSSVGIGWLEKGGVYVLANIRGGGEFGPAWHKAAIKEKRQNAYDDFYAVSEDLIQKKITSPEHLGVFGWSNGGLMAGVVFTQRPDLFNAVVVGAPLLDMKRYSKLLAGASWIGEYGDPDNEKDWKYLKKYSPYHNIVDTKEYPEVFFITSTKDDRVHPAHARKMAAKMKTLGHPYIYHETIEGGHGAASTNDQQAHVSASIYTYLNMKLNSLKTE